MILTLEVCWFPSVVILVESSAASSLRGTRTQGFQLFEATHLGLSVLRYAVSALDTDAVLCPSIPEAGPRTYPTGH